MASSADGGVLKGPEQNNHRTFTPRTSDVIPTSAPSRRRRFNFGFTTAHETGTLDDGDGDLRILYNKFFAASDGSAIENFPPLRRASLHTWQLALALPFPPKNILDLLHPEFCIEEGDEMRTLQFIIQVAMQLRQGPQYSVHFLVLKLVEMNVLRGSIVSGKKIVDLSAYEIIFACIGRITMLYKGQPKDGQPLAIDTQGAPCFSAPDLLTSFATRSIPEMVANMGDVLPTKSNMSAHPLEDLQGSSTSDTLFVSYLNFHALSTLARIEIVWVDTISAHLNFDLANRKLFLFRFPSFCRLHATRNSVVAGVLESYQTADFTIQKMMEEILVSYSLIFQLDTQAQQLYRKEKSNPNNRLADPLLDELCLQSAIKHKKWSFFGIFEPKKESFEASTEFPILSKRLLRLQKFSQGIPTNRISALWKDRRDMSRWYTFWAVIGIGGIGLVLSLIQTSLAAESVQLAREQLRQGAVSPQSVVSTIV